MGEMHRLRMGLMDGTWEGRTNRIEVYINGDRTHPRKHGMAGMIY
jgi:hypothetical protein